MLPDAQLAQFAQKLSARQDRPVSLEEARDHISNIILETARNFGRAYVFGPHEVEDIRQAAYLLALEALATGRYQPDRDLASFLYVHIKNRLLNQRRKSWWRRERPCACCDQWNPGPTPCERWVVWNRLNESRRSLSTTYSISGEDAPAVPAEDPSEVVVLGELTSYIETHLNPDLLEDYRVFVADGDLPKARRGAVRRACQAILRYSPWSPNPSEPPPEPPPPKSKKEPKPKPPKAPKTKKVPKPKPMPRPRGRQLVLNGISRNLAEWAEIYGLQADTLRYRLRSGWSLRDALRTPVDQRKSHPRR